MIKITWKREIDGFSTAARGKKDCVISQAEGRRLCSIAFLSLNRKLSELAGWPMAADFSANSPAEQC
jgi:hypothetical protein